MPPELRRTLRTGRARVRPGRVMPAAVLLAALVALGAGIGGTSDLTGARWFPHFRPSPPGVPTGTIMSPVTATGVTGGRGNAAVPLWLIVTVGVFAAAGVTALIWGWWRGPHQPPPPPTDLPRSSLWVASLQVPQVESERELEPERLRSGIALALQVLDEEREPADAIVRAWLGLQETAEQSGIVRHAAETPTEFASRILSGALVDDRAVRTLLRLYLRTRFGDHSVTTSDVLEARAALQRLMASRQPAGAAAVRTL